MDLQAKEAGKRNVRLSLLEVNRLLTIEPNFNGRSLRPNLQLVPLTFWFYPRINLFLRSLGEHFSSSRLIIEETPDRSLAPATDIALITDHFMVFGDSLTPELDSGVVSLSNELCFEAHFEVGVFFLAHEELIVGYFFVEKTGYDCSSFDPEEFFLTFPPAEGFSIEKRYEACVLFLIRSAKTKNNEKKE